MIIKSIDELRNALKVLLTSNVRIGILGASAGSGLMASLASISGISAAFVEAHFPHSKEATCEYLGFTPENFVCMETALEQAMRAYYRAYQPGNKRTLGIGATAAIASGTAHRGDHRVWVAAFSEDHVSVYYAKLQKGVGDEVRSRDSLACDLLIGGAILRAVGEDVDTQLPDNVEFMDFYPYPKNRTVILLEQRPYFRSDGARLTFDEMKEDLGISQFSESLLPCGAIIFPGSFNPPHFGHLGIADACTSKYSMPVVFAIDSNPPHKGSFNQLEPWELIRRAKLLKGRNVLFTWNAPYYVNKAQILPYCPMIIGVDSFQRMLESRWGLTPEELNQAFRKYGTKIIVPDRINEKGELVTINDFDNTLYFPCERLQVRFDVSSTEIRNKLAMGN
jgi:hypothetical protein